MPEHNSTIKALFLDIGGVFLTNGWDTEARKEAAIKFGLDFEELNGRHRIIFDAYESGKSTLDEYLILLIFYKPRNFTREDIKAFMMQKSQPYPEMIELIRTIKRKHHLLTIAVNNEGRELNDYRIQQFDLKSFIDVFASSCFVHMRKPDMDMYQLAIDLAQVKPEEIVYLDDRPVFIEAACQLGIQGVEHVDVATTKSALAQYGLI